MRNKASAKRFPSRLLVAHKTRRWESKARYGSFYELGLVQIEIRGVYKRISTRISPKKNRLKENCRHRKDMNWCNPSTREDHARKWHRIYEWTISLAIPSRLGRKINLLIRVRCISPENERRMLANISKLHYTLITVRSSKTYATFNVYLYFRSL